MSAQTNQDNKRIEISLDSLIDNIPDAFVAFDRHWHYIAANKKALQMLNRKKVEVLGKSVYELFPDMDTNPIFQKTKEVMKSRRYYQVEYYSDLDEGWLQANMYPIPEGVAVYYTNISKQKEFEEVLSQQAEFINLAHEAMFIQDETNCILFWNKGAQDLYGWTKKQAEGQVAYKLLKTQFPIPREEIYQIIQQQKFWEGQLVHSTQNGRKIIVDSRWTLIVDKKRRKRILEITHDITEQEEYKKSLLIQKERIADIVENLQIGFYSFNKQWKITYINKKAEEFADLRREKILGKVLWEVLPEIENYPLAKVFRKVMKERKSVRLENYYPDTHIWYATSVYPTKDGIAVYTMDITSQHSLKEEVENTKNRLEAILQNVADGITVQNDKGKIIYANKKAAEMMGYGNVEELLTAPLLEYVRKFAMFDEHGNPFSPEGLPGRRAFQGEKNPYAFIKFLNKQTKEEKWSLVKSTLISEGVDNKNIVVNIIQDITEVKELDERKNEFISMASHELKTPLTSLKVYLHLLQEKTDLDEAQKKEYLQRANIQLEHLQVLINELLDQSNIQQGRLALKKEKVLFDDFIKHIVDNYQQIVSSHKLIVEGETNSHVTLDTYRAEQVFINLLSNAVKYSPDAKEVLVRLSSKKDSVSVSIKDFGIGIPPSQQGAIFKPYYRVSGEQELTFPGLGMGLYITAEIVKRHKGSIKVYSTPGKGSLFTIIFPKN